MTAILFCLWLKHTKNEQLQNTKKTQKNIENEIKHENRCSVVFETTEAMLIGLNAFENSVKSGNTGSIKRILRIKNTFKVLPNPGADSTNGAVKDLSRYRYCDIKVSVFRLACYFKQ